MMHNGGIRGFKKIRRDLINMLSDDVYSWINGETDSEHIFALMMQNTENANPELSDMTNAFRSTFHDLERLKKKKGLDEPSILNMVVTDGERMIATRYSSDPEKESRTLYFTHGKEYVCEGNICRMLPANKRTDAMLIVSEKLDEFVEEWTPVPDNHALLVENDLSYELISLE
jgi:predicted glutamine amidotransferase